MTTDELLKILDQREQRCRTDKVDMNGSDRERAEVLESYYKQSYENVTRLRDRAEIGDWDLAHNFQPADLDREIAKIPDDETKDDTGSWQIVLRARIRNKKKELARADADLERAERLRELMDLEQQRDAIGKTIDGC